MSAAALPRLALDYGRLSQRFHSPAQLLPLEQPRWVAWNVGLGAQLGFGERAAPAGDWLDYFHGARPWPGARPLAMAYAGHQFGAWVPQLGDGRAVLLGSLRDRRGDSWELHIKGAGPTAYSRGFDGRAVLRSTVREYLCSEAMHGLGVPTTRALGLVGSRSPVQRETQESAALLARVARSHIRFGHFEYAASAHGVEALRELGEYVLAHHYPEIQGQPEPWLRLLAAVSRRTAETIAAWHCWGFCHGVMNTDNMSVLGDTIDYGPFGFLDDFQPNYTPNLTDSGGRYAFQQQASVGLWNCRALASALLPLIADSADGAAGTEAVRKAGERAKAVLDDYGLHFWRRYLGMMARRLGLRPPARDQDLPDHRGFLEPTLELMAARRCDYHLFFRALAEDPAGMTAPELLRRAGGGDPDAVEAWLQGWRARLPCAASDPQLAEGMQVSNPIYVLRQSWAQQAIADTEKGGAMVADYARLLAAPFARQPGYQYLEEAPPRDGRGLRLSCSS